MPEKGDRMSAEIQFFNWFMDGTRDNLLCGEFELDELSFSGRPFCCNIGAVSIPQDSAFNTQDNTKTWENVTLELIAKEISRNAGVELYYEGDKVDIAIIEQTKRTDCNFLYELCRSYGMAMKVFANKIVIFDEEIYEKGQARTILYEKDMISWEYRTSVAGTYTGATFSFVDPNDEAEYVIDVGGGSRILEINMAADSIADAEKKAIAMLNEENKKETTVSIKMKANPGLYAGSCVVLDGFGRLDDKYYVEQVRTAVSGGGATQMQLSLRKVTDRIKTTSVRAAEAAVEESTAGGTEYVIQAGDTLWEIAGGNPSRCAEIYKENKDVIESAAKARGKTDSNNGHWIYPGTKIVIPGE